MQNTIRDNTVRDRVAVVGVLALGIAAFGAPAAAASPSATPSDPGCAIVQAVNTNPDDSPYEGALDWWAVEFSTDPGLESWSYHFVNKAPDEAWIYDYYLRADLDASAAAGHLVIPHVDGAGYLTVPDTERTYFWVLNPDGDSDPVIECVAG